MKTLRIGLNVNNIANKTIRTAVVGSVKKIEKKYSMSRLIWQRLFACGLLLLVFWPATRCLAADTTPPTIISVGSVNGSAIGVCFSEPVDPVTAAQASNYKVNGSTAPASVTLRADGSSVVLTLSAAVSGSFSVTVNNVRDLSGNAIAANSSATGSALGLGVSDIGNPSPPSDDFTCGGNSIVVTAGGYDIWNNEDQFNFIQTAVAGDFDIQVRVARLDYIGNTWSKAGLMVRENLTPGSRNGYVAVDPDLGANAYELNYRDVQEGTYASWAPNSFGVPYPNAWVRLQRVGGTFNAYRGTDGVNWDLIGQATPSTAYPDTVLIGLCTCAVQAGGVIGTTTAEYDSLSMIATPPTHPVVVSAAPVGVAGPDSVVSLTVQDGVKVLNPASIKLTLDGAAVTPTASKSGNVTTIQYAPSRLLPAGTHSAVLTYADNSVPPFTNSYAFSFTVLHYEGPNGNYYEFISGYGLSWQAAKAAAEQRTLSCTHGHLVTITSADEDVFVEMLRQEYVQAGALADGELWAGGFQLPNQASTGDGWYWVNNDGPIPGYNGGSLYANWNLGSGEPNDCCNTVGYEDNEENFLGIGRFGNGGGWNDENEIHGLIVGYAVEFERITEPVDIKPGSSVNPIQLDTPGKIPVAILSTPTFDASTVDPSTITFGRTGTEATPVSYSLSDVNGDNRKDLVCQFNIQDPGLICGDTVAKLKGNTFTGCPIKGSDSVQILGCPPYALSIQSLQNVQHLTDVYLKVTPILQGHIVPGTALGIVLKSYDIYGKLRWTKTVQNAVLTPNGDGSSTAHLQYTDMEHGQNVKAQMLVKDPASKITQVLNAQGRVLFRPDLAVVNVTAPAQANVHQAVNIVATINELKGDLGATGNVYLKDGDTVIDTTANVSVSPLRSVGVVFVARFDTAGLHQLKVVVSDETPADYDLSNNEQDFSIQVVIPPLQSVFYCDSYYHYESDYQYVIENPYWISTYHDQYTNENASQTLYLPVPIQAVSRVTLQLSGDGVQVDNLEALNVPIYNYNYGCYSYSYGSWYLGDNISFYIQSYHDCYGNQYSYAQFSKYAYSEVYFSSFYDKIYGQGSSYSYSAGYGTFLNAANSVDSRFIVETDAGAFGGSGNFGVLYSYPYNNPFDYYEYDWMDGLYDEHVTGSSQGKNVYGSTCDVTIP